MPTREEDELARHARQLTTDGRAGEAERLWRQLLGKHHVVDIEYDDWLRGAADCYRALRRHRECAYIALFLHYFDQARDYFPTDGAAFERALCFELERRYAEAARGFELAGKPVMAAIDLERAGDFVAAHALWRQVQADPRLAGQLYERALVETNLGLCARRLGDLDASRRHLALAQQILEEAADEFESRGARDRAFYCYQVLIELGKGGGSFENLAEGYLNCIRVMKEDNLKFYVLQYCEDFLALALERKEFHAAATLAREAAEYTLRAGMPYERRYLARSAEIWEQCATRTEETGAPIELAENALVAAIDAWCAIGHFARVGACYERLALLDLPEKRRRRYAVAAERYRGTPRRDLDGLAFPESLRQPHAYQDVWHLDLVEWELDGDYSAVCATLIGDLRHADPFRRRALALLLEPVPAAADAAGWARVAQRLGELQLYAGLRPLERLYERPEPLVRAAVMRALGQMYYKRTFPLLTQGLADPDESVRHAGLETLRRLHFPHAFDALARLYSETKDLPTRQAALASLGEIGTVEAGEFLIGVVRQESEPLQKLAQRLLARFENPEIIAILRSYMDSEAGAARAALGEVLRQMRRPETSGLPR
jgi:hypothetical protein